MVRTGEEEQYQYLPIECPKCGLQGKVKISRLDRTFACKKCKRVFHVTLDGVVAGERPAGSALGDAGLVTADDRPPWIVRRFEQLSRVWQWGVLGLVAAGLLYGLALWMEPEEPLPGDLEERAVLAGKAVGQGDLKMLKRLAKSRTSGDVGKWYDKVRPEAWKDVTGESAVEVKVDRIRKNLKKYDGKTPIMDARATIQVHVAGKPEVVLDLIWSEDKFSEWWLDGEATLKEARGPKAGKGTPNPQQTQQQKPQPPVNPNAD